ncbi:MAG: response regulator transcription factor [Acidobacteria bacterium]|nr:response regulator transcription factor [Acidobacteriota bacterium]
MKKILVVEDDPGIALGLEEDLTLEGYEVEVASNGELALRRAREKTFDLILLDVMLPGKDGFQICRELRLGGASTPIILLTARTQEAEKVLGLQLGADDYVTKPFSPLELRARIQAVLRRSAAAPASEVFRFGDMEVDFARCELRRGETKVEITPVEFRLLSTFIESRGRVLSRQYLLDHLWADANCVDRVVDTHVSNLRKKIETDPSQPRHLVSVRGMGYRFDG